MKKTPRKTLYLTTGLHIGGFCNHFTGTCKPAATVLFDVSGEHIEGQPIKFEGGLKGMWVNPFNIPWLVLGNVKTAIRMEVLEQGGLEPMDVALSGKAYLFSNGEAQGFSLTFKGRIRQDGSVALGMDLGIYNLETLTSQIYTSIGGTANDGGALKMVRPPDTHT